MSAPQVEVLFAKAKECLKGGDHETAVASVSSVLELATQDESTTKEALARYYMFYGEALLRLSQSQNDLISDEMRKEQRKEATDEKEEATDGAPTDQSEEVAVPEKERTPEQQAETEVKPQAPEQEKATEAQPAGSAAEEKHPDFFLDQGAFDSMMAANSSEDRELAWNSLENARVLASQAIAEGKTAQNQSLLADIHALLAELQLENSNCEESIKEYENAINIHQSMGGENVRELAYLHFMAVMAAENGQLNEAYAKHLDCAFEVICAQLVALLVKHGMDVSADAECDVILEALAKLLDDKKGTANIEEKDRKEMEDLRQSLEDLVDRVDNPPEAADGTQEIMDQVRQIMSQQLGGAGVTEEAEAGTAPTTAAPVAKENEAPVRQLGDFGKGRKRSLEEAGIQRDEDSEPNSKRLRENGSSAAQ